MSTQTEKKVKIKAPHRIDEGQEAKKRKPLKYDQYLKS
jgi:hypothetical protein